MTPASATTPSGRTAELFGYYECDSVAYAAGIQAQSPVVDKWNEYMKDVMVMDFDLETGTSVQLKQVFLHPKESR